MNDYFPWYALAVACSQAFVLSWLCFLGKSRAELHYTTHDGWAEMLTAGEFRRD